MSLFWNMLKVGPPVAGALLRSTGNWDTWGSGTLPRSAGDIPLASNIVSGDTLFVAIWHLEYSDIPQSGNTGWSRINKTTNGCQRELWTRIATADSGDNFNLDEISSQGGQGGGAAHMICLSGLGWSASPYWDSGSTYDGVSDVNPGGRETDTYYSGVADLAASAQDSVIISTWYKTWGAPYGTRPTSPSFSYDSTNSPNFNYIDDQYVLGEDRDMHFGWGWLLHANGDNESLSDGSMQQSPLDSDAGNSFAQTVRMIETP